MSNGNLLGASQTLGYVLSLPISTAIVGFRSVEEVEEAVEIARRLESLSAEEMSWFKKAT